MSTPILSIIIPFYNVEPFIERCLDSVASQTFHDYELLLIDDGSTDNSSVICKKYADKNPQSIKYLFKKNEGQGPARDLGVKLAKGKYITFLDADDWWAPEFCEQMISAIDILDADIAVCDINYVEEDNNLQNQIVSQIRLPESQKIVPNDFPDSINRMRTFLWGKIFRRSLYIKSGLKQSKRKYEDFPVMSALVALSRSVCRVDRPMYFYYRNRKNSTINGVSALDSMPDSIRDLAENFKKLNLFETYAPYIEKMAFSQVRFALRKMDTLVPSGEELHKKSLKESLFKVMKGYFPNWKNPHGLNLCVCGSDTLNKIVSTFLFQDADSEIDSKKKYAYTFIDLLDAKETVKQINHHKLDLGKYVIVRLLETGREEDLNKQYAELTDSLPDAITIFLDEEYNISSYMDETAIWNIADFIWYTLFSGNQLGGRIRTPNIITFN